jgi:hypothetical protein
LFNVGVGDVDLSGEEMGLHRYDVEERTTVRGNQEVDRGRDGESVGKVGRGRRDMNGMNIVFYYVKITNTRVSTNRYDDKGLGGARY